MDLNPFNCFIIKVTNRCDFFVIFLYFLFLVFPTCFGLLPAHHQGVSSAAVYVLPLGSCSALLFVYVRLLCGLVRCGD